MTFSTYREFKQAVYSWLEQNNYEYAAMLILQNKRAAPGNWIKWAERVKAGIVKNPQPPEKPNTPPLKDGDLFGEPITTGRPLKRR